MEVVFLLVIIASAGAGLVLRPRVSRTVVRVLLAVGLASLALPLGILGFFALGGRGLSVWTGGLASVLLLAVAGLTLPFAVAARWGR